MPAHEPTTGSSAPASPASGRETPPDTSPSAGYFADLRALMQHSGALTRELCKLFGAETRLYLSAAVLILALVVVGSFLLAMLWLFCGAAFAMWLVQSLQVDPVIALLTVAGATLVLLFAIVLWIRGLSRHLQFRHTREALAKVWPSTSEPTNETRES